jgi:hypothetical protein
LIDGKRDALVETLDTKCGAATATGAAAAVAQGKTEFLNKAHDVVAPEKTV